MLAKLPGRWLAAIMALALVSASPAQFEEAYEPDPDAAKAFQELVKSYRERPALHVHSKLEFKLVDGEQAAQPGSVEASFIYVKDQGGRVRVREFTCHFSDGVFYAVHDDTEHSYFRAEYLGSPYWELLAHFQDLPYPHLALLWGEDAMDEVWMQMQPQTPLLVPTEVAQVENDGAVRRKLVLTSPSARLEMLIDPKTSLIESMEHEITAGMLVEAGTKRVTTYHLEYPDTAPDDLQAAIAFHPGERQRVDTLVALLPPREPVAAGGGAQQLGGVGAGKEAPNFVLATLDDKAVDLEDLRGKVVVLDFWATWCGPCKAALPELHKLASWARDEQLPVEIITLNVFEKRGEQDTPDARRESAKAFWDARGFSLPVAMDYTDQTALAYGVQRIPQTFIIRSDGIIHDRHSGFSGSYLENLKNEVREALAALESADDGEPLINEP